MTKGSEDYNKGKHLPSPVTPVTNVCFKIVIPNAVEYRAALFGVLGQLSQWYTWEHPTDGTTCFDCEEAAQLWAKAISEAYFEEDCETPVNCEDVANCITTDENTQQAIAGFVGSSEEVQQAIRQYLVGDPDFVKSITRDAYTGVPMLPAVAGASLTEAANCDKDKLFGSITALVEQLNDNNIDFLEQFEIESNTIERASALFAAIPLFETLPIDDALAFLDTVMGEFKEFYEAAYTTSLKDTYRCDLFCEAEAASMCALSFDMIIQYYEGRLGASLNPDALFLNMVEFLVAGSWSGTQVVDAMSLAQLIIWREASNFLGVSFRSFQTVGLLGANNPSSDWAILCDNCNDEVTCQDFTQGMGGWIGSNPTNYVVGQGWARYPTQTNRIGCGKVLNNTTNPVVRVVVTFLEPHTGYVRIRNLQGGQQTRQDAVGRTVWNLTGASITSGLSIDCGPPDPVSGQPIPTTQRIINTCYFYAN